MGCRHARVTTWEAAPGWGGGLPNHQAEGVSPFDLRTETSLTGSHPRHQVGDQRGVVAVGLLVRFQSRGTTGQEVGGATRSAPCQGPEHRPSMRRGGLSGWYSSMVEHRPCKAETSVRFRHPATERPPPWRAWVNAGYQLQEKGAVAQGPSGREARRRHPPIRALNICNGDGFVTHNDCRMKEVGVDKCQR